MKRWLPALIYLWILTGCARNPGEMEQGLALRSRILQGSGCTFTAEITADYKDKLHTFTLSCQADGAGDLTFTVTAPESIAGVAGQIRRGEGSLTFEDTALQFDAMADGQITPVLSPWVFLKTLRCGCITAAGMEGEQLRLTIDDRYEEDALTLDIWVEGETPVRAEILYDGRRILSLDVKDFAIV